MGNSATARFYHCPLVRSARWRQAESQWEGAVPDDHGGRKFPRMEQRGDYLDILELNQAPLFSFSHVKKEICISIIVISKIQSSNVARIR